MARYGIQWRSHSTDWWHDYPGSFQEFVHFLRTDPQFYVDSADELMERTALVLKRMDGELPKLFGMLPRLPYGITTIP